MTLPVDTPKLPKWPFLLGDALLLGTAWIVANQSRDPFTGSPLIAIVTCVALGALLGVIPFLTDYARKQDEALDERQRALEALSRTVAASAEQISIAAGGLHEIAEISHRNLKSAEQLPHKLQEKIAEFKAELDNANAEEREELEKELATLRAGESERLESAADKIAKATAEFAKLEAAAQKHVAASTDALAKASAAVSQAGSAAQDKLVAALAQIETKLAAFNSVAQPLKAAAPAASTPFIAPRAAPDTVIPGESSKPALSAASRAPVQDTPPSVPPEAANPIESSSAESGKAAVIPQASAQSLGPPEAEPKGERKRAPKKPKVDTPADTALPLEIEKSSPPPAEISSPSRLSPSSDDSVQVAPDEPMTEPAHSEPAERALSADGATRLLVTAYIGIGNRLFIRGAGPGLSWDKGVPLQFVSIGKWRWETGDTTAPVKFKLYKNDELECAALGGQTLDPGHQHEFTATF